MPERHSEDGFTLIELMVVVLVIAVLISVAVPTMLGARTRSQDGTAKSNLRASLEVAAGYATANAGTWPTSSAMTADETSMTYVDSSTASTAPNIVSVEGGTGIVATTLSRSGTCWRLSNFNGLSVTTQKSGGCASANSGVVTTFAGSNTTDLINGTGTAAAFSNPQDVAADAAGNLYVADTGNQVVRKITRAGVVTTLAGSGSWGTANGTGAAASFAEPTGVVADSAGNVYVSETDNSDIRKITPAGVVTTFVGTGTPGAVNGTGTGASFSGPSGMAIDATDTIYLADTSNHLIRKITSAGVVTTLAGSGVAGSTNGTGTGASFDSPAAVAVDASGNVYVADAMNNKIRKITPAGVVTTLAGSGASSYADGTGAAAAFSYPTDVTVDGAGNVYVVDAGNIRIRKVTPAGVVTTLAGSGNDAFADGTTTAASFSSPWGICFSPTGDLFVADQFNARIRQIS